MKTEKKYTLEEVVVERALVERIGALEEENGKLEMCQDALKEIVERHSNHQVGDAYLCKWCNAGGTEHTVYCPYRIATETLDG